MNCASREYAAEPLPRKEHVQFRSIPGLPPREFFLYVPRAARRDRILVLMHGISENGCELALRFAEEAEARGVVLVAPLMRRSVVGQYQQLLDPKTGIRADRLLFDILDAVRGELGLKACPVDIFGFSGGGQFAHRFAFNHPYMIRNGVLVAPGWFTFPDRAAPYPQGLRNSPEKLDVPAIRSIPFHVIVGDEDIVRDSSLRRSQRIDRIQGRNRLERARRWHHAMLEWGADPRTSLTVLPGLAHSFAQAARNHHLPRLTFELLEAGINSIS
ncbi:Poly(Aspartic acid) hydrolase-1 [Sphingopyxis sp. LC81]|nr:Poly(Aspartic acid) hydrolase-1 [Sphingopyxis sp. LC81]